MRIVICDDDINITTQLKNFIQEYFKINNLNLPETVVFNDSTSLLKDAGAKDIVFLDVEMPNINGINAGSIIKKQNPEAIIIVLTSYLQYLDDAMRFHVFRYLSKPIEKERLFRNFKEAISLYVSNNLTIAIETNENIITVNTNHIVMIEACGRKSIVHTIFKDIESSYTINKWLKLLNHYPSLYQTHRSYIINLRFVDSFDHTLIFLNNHKFKAYLTRRKYIQFKNDYFLYIENTR